MSDEQNKPNSVTLDLPEGFNVAPSSNDLPEGFNVTTSGSQPPVNQILPEGQTTVQGLNVPSEKDMAAQIMRYGPNIALALATRGASLPFALQASLEAGTAAMSEITARQIERANRDPELAELERGIGEDLKAGAFAGALDASISGITHGLGKTGKYLINRFITPRKLNPEIEAAQGILSKLSSKDEALIKKWRKYKGIGGPHPFTFAADELNSEEQGFAGSLVRFFGRVARGGTGSGEMMENSLRNEERVADAIQEYFKKRTANISGPEAGRFFESILGKIDPKGKGSLGAVFEPVESFRKFLYRRFDQAILKHAEHTIDGTALRDYITKGGPEAKKMYRQLRALNLLPPLEGLETKTVKRTLTTVTKKASKEGDRVADVTKTDLLEEGAQPSRSMTRTESTIADLGTQKTETERIFEILSDPRATKEEVEEAWKNIPVTNVDPIIRTIDSTWSSTDTAFNSMMMKFRSQLEKPYESWIQTVPEIAEKLKTARSYFGQKEAFLYNATIDAFRKAVNNNPSGVIGMINPLGANPTKAYDNLMKLKRALYFSATTPPSITPGKIAEGVQEIKIMKGGGKETLEKAYEAQILKPLRFRFLAKSTDEAGNLSSDRLLQNINKIEGEAPEMLEEMFGSKTSVKYLKDLASTYYTVTHSNPGASIFIQLKTAGAIGAATGGAVAFFTGNNPVAGASLGGAISAGGILMSPLILGKILTSPNLIRGFTTTLEESSKAGRITAGLAMILRKVSEMGIVSKTFRESDSPAQHAFYSFETPEQQ